MTIRNSPTETRAAELLLHGWKFHPSPLKDAGKWEGTWQAPALPSGTVLRYATTTIAYAEFCRRCEREIERNELHERWRKANAEIPRS